MASNTDDIIKSGQRLDFVKSQLASYSGKKIMHDTYTFVLCPYHSERTPSGRIYHNPNDRWPGTFRCYACGAKAKWDELAPRLGLKGFKVGKPKDEFTIDIKNDASLFFEESEADLVPEKIKLRPLPKDKVWRGIKTNFLRKIGGKICTTKNPKHGWTKPKVYLPVLIKGELSGYVKARFRKHEEFPSYVNAPGPWSKSKGLFPYDYAIQMMLDLDSTTVVLVEGPRDALRLLQFGIPALCILGTHSWEDAKTRLLEIGGVETVVILMDGDCAGKKAIKLVRKSVRLTLNVKVVDLCKIEGSPYIPYAHLEEPTKAAKADGVTLWDPGNVPRRILRQLKQKYFSKE